ncbi:3-methyl-2-oxobutanoate hydroxymethyltransferase [candidate division GN15 bacterium]|uniref:3-methyl-2-oxobutanoate hydroxymethyltransferase n=1 Tax=candidate division GN15 bacterium TaxID=2072418 RepID=A0A855WWS2_9BACT|nr:MAG: 3-methyl-2-oxobutanoate hydroxymethyltransferase [candidate division GN15 bacterium]
MSTIRTRKKTTVQTIVAKKANGEKITCLTAYDYFIGRLLDQAGIDIVLVGDSAANVVHGFKTTIPITLDVMIAHTAAVSRGVERALLVTDMPFLSFQPSIETAIISCGRCMKEGFAEAVKIEGGIEMVPTVKRLIECGIPVMGHIGLTPQSIHRFGGPKVQAREERSRNYLKESALALEEAGCFSCVLELMEANTAAEITSSLTTMATIGIGAGRECDGQVLVTNDLLGLREPEFTPKFLKQYADLPPIISEAVSKYINEVKSGTYPGPEHSY